MESEKKKMIVFENKKIRRVWHEDDWWFSVVDVVGVLTESIDAKDYWYKLKIRELEHGIELSTICRQLKMKSSDGKMYLTNCSNKQGLFRIIQSIPSKKAEPFKQWLAKVGGERIDEIENPELAMEGAMKNYSDLGYSEKWINQRLKTIEVRKDLVSNDMTLLAPLMNGRGRE